MKQEKHKELFTDEELDGLFTLLDELRTMSSYLGYLLDTVLEEIDAGQFDPDTNYHEVMINRIRKYIGRESQ